jgi:hypothetical protein
MLAAAQGARTGQEGPSLGERTGRRARAERRLLIDLAPLRRSRDLRCLVLGELVSALGTQLTTVAVPYQVYQLTRSSLDVGLGVPGGRVAAVPSAAAGGRWGPRG